MNQTLVYVVIETHVPTTATPTEPSLSIVRGYANFTFVPSLDAGTRLIESISGACSTVIEPPYFTLKPQDENVTFVGWGTSMERAINIVEEREWKAMEDCGSDDITKMRLREWRRRTWVKIGGVERACMQVKCDERTQSCYWDVLVVPLVKPERTFTDM